jgi:hypothetical protein
VNGHFQQPTGKERVVGTAAVRSFRIFGALVEKAGPYLLLELLLPGGTLFALLLYACRRHRSSGNAAGRGALTGWPGQQLCRIIALHSPAVASAWHGRHRERDGLEALAF